MSTPASTVERPALGLNDPGLTSRVNALRPIDNRTNWLYLAREYAYLIVVIGAAIAFYQGRESWGLAWAWDVPVTFLAVALIGAGQHRLTTLGHEASHYMLFRDRQLNELASDWLCMFPVFSTTHGYRIQHLAHHQHVNDPERDPDLTQMEASGHRFDFPMPRWRFVWSCVVKQLLWLPGLLRYTLVRGRYAGVGDPKAGRKAAVPVIAALVYIILACVALRWARDQGVTWLLASVPLVLWSISALFFGLLPRRFYPESPLKPEVGPRSSMMMRVAHVTLVLTAIAWLSAITGRPWNVYYGLLWLLPLFTAFPFFMLLRQVVQHGNADRGRLTNTRVFRVGRLIGFAVFPMGMDYHLPHHLFPMVPHYRLRRLHELLGAADAYREHAEVVDGYFLGDPAVLDLMARPAPG